ncbi:hypothetical protein XELAEV_18005275mg [Xenopus laevis]|uniref:Uncharacterized protein n=1 Tax=Xenopus laevis TaxID=8355 RepID=A0A974DX04_XENLA|nr:hypothetical protein XELAEV_18005275mg [Xenopus laevis]
MLETWVLAVIKHRLVTECGTSNLFSENKVAEAERSRNHQCLGKSHLVI